MRFIGGSGTLTYLSITDIGVVPEPGTIFVPAALAASALLARRRRWLTPRLLSNG